MTTFRPSTRRKQLPEGLLAPSSYPHAVRRIRLVETHISWVFLTGDYAYKVKKPVDLGFANFTTLERRRLACEEELRLNRRLAPRIYLDVVEIRGTPEAPTIGGTGPVLDYAVKMRQFSQASLASRAIARGSFGAAAVDDLASAISQLHTRAPSATPGRLGAPGTVLAAALQNFEQMMPLVRRSADRMALNALQHWTEREFDARRQAMAARKQAGLVRECHGDLHLGNVVLIDGKPVPFDGIEFNAELSWIDVMSDVAFLFMDLADRGHAELGWRFVNRYLEETGDYGGVEVMRFYVVYRALVRAKVHLMRGLQAGIARQERARLTRAFRGYLRLAQRCSAPGPAAIIITHGLSGSGKTTLTQGFIEALGCIRLRSDVERKRMHKRARLDVTGSAPGAGIYSREASAATYRRLGQLAKDVVLAGYPVVVDATFLKRTEREAFRALAEALEVPFVILDCRAPLALLRQRVAARHARGDDASEAGVAVLERQIGIRQPLTPAEMTASLPVAMPGRALKWSWRPNSASGTRNSLIQLRKAAGPRRIR